LAKLPQLNFRQRIIAAEFIRPREAGDGVVHFAPTLIVQGELGVIGGVLRIGLDGALVALAGEFAFAERVVDATHSNKYIRVMRIGGQGAVVPRERFVQERFPSRNVPRGAGAEEIAEGTGNLEVAAVKIP